MEKKKQNGENGELQKDLNDEATDEKNSIAIAGRRFEVYNQTILNKLQKFDQIEITFLDTYYDRASYIIRQWEALGIMPTNGYPLKFGKREEDIVTRNGKKFKKFVNTITLAKQPDQFRFTKI